MTERTIDKMVEWGEVMKLMLEKLNSPSANLAIAQWNESRRLALEEAKEKPTATASLLGMPVIENALLPKGTAFLVVQEKGVVTQMQKVYDESERPSPQADIVGELKGIVSAFRWKEEHNGYEQGQNAVCDAIEEIIAKYEGAK